MAKKRPWEGKRSGDADAKESMATTSLSLSSSSSMVTTTSLLVSHFSRDETETPGYGDHRASTASSSRLPRPSHGARSGESRLRLEPASFFLFFFATRLFFSLFPLSQQKKEKSELFLTPRRRRWPASLASIGDEKSIFFLCPRIDPLGDTLPAISFQKKPCSRNGVLVLLLRRCQVSFCIERRRGKCSRF